MSQANVYSINSLLLVFLFILIFAIVLAIEAFIYFNRFQKRLSFAKVAIFALVVPALISMGGLVALGAVVKPHIAEEVQEKLDVESFPSSGVCLSDTRTKTTEDIRKTSGEYGRVTCTGGTYVFFPLQLGER